MTLRAWMVTTAVMVSAHATGADTPKIAPHEMGTWDCNGSKLQSVTLAPGDNLYVWHGECPGAEGFSVVSEPESPTVTIFEFYDAKTKNLSARVVNSGKRPIKVKLYVFVGFA
jgi:hypothetical protein